MTSRPPENRLAATCRSCAALLVLALAGGCSSDNTDNYSQIWGVARTMWNKDDSGVLLAQASAIPYSTIGYRLDDGREQLLVLATQMGDAQLYTSAAHVAIELRHGRIVRTTGFAHNVASQVLPSANEPPFSRESQSVNLLADFPDDGLYSVAISCNDSKPTPESIKILGAAIHTMRIDEHCTSQTLDWSYDNVFWIDPVNFRVWRSIQYTHPKQDAFEIEVLRPVGDGS
jgi:hypothetical protein